MPLPGTHTVNTVDLTVSSPSIGASPVTVYMRVPFRSRILKFTGILGGTITTADGTITVAVNGVTVGTFTVTQSGSAAGQLFSGATTTTILSYVNEDDVISFTPSGASGSSIPMYFSAALRQA